MTHKFPVPEEDRLERMIGRVFEIMPGPNEEKLFLTENRITEMLESGKTGEVRRNRIPWWIVIILAGGMASAAWWAGERFFSTPKNWTDTGMRQSTVDIRQQKRDDSGNISDTGSNEQNIESDIYEDSESPVIYQREDLRR